MQGTTNQASKRRTITNLLVAAIGGSLLAGLALLADNAWSVLALVLGGGALLLEASARRGNQVRGQLAEGVVALHQPRPAAAPRPVQPAAPAQRQADVVDLAAHRGESQGRAEELPEGHLAPVVQLDFRRSAPQQKMRRHG